MTMLFLGVGLIGAMIVIGDIWFIVGYVVGASLAQVLIRKARRRNG